ncbi:MAG: hypothetical protein Q8S27_16790 [Hoeflea sp.]|uniref:hypothetical protein n=1 Tax=Hoeflea sp. TaxID=1940281 RepID=UPI0027313FD5|nr:hypothetical protein [Hoeflea sp.]MDP2119310.1 hypothetical protein [Hoeflea sp.]MDP3526236.1 hypothetical protein [Hoeflea sp.]
MKQILAAAALTMAFTVGAFAQTTASNTRTELDAFAGNDPTVWDMMMDSEGVDVDDATFESNWAGATPERQAALQQACTEAEEAKATFSDAVASRCKTALGN